VKIVTGYEIQGVITFDSFLYLFTSWPDITNEERSFFFGKNSRYFIYNKDIIILGLDHRLVRRGADPRSVAVEDSMRRFSLR